MTGEMWHDGTRDWCPGTPALAAYAEGRTTERERSEIERHLLDCGDCREIVAAAVEFAIIHGRRPRRARRRRGLVAAAALLAAAALILAVRLARPASPTTPALTALVDAVGTTRPVEPRLTAGFRYGPARGPFRSGEAADLPPDLQIAAAELAQSLSSSRTAETLHAYGLGQLVTHRYDKAVTALDEARRLDPSSAPVAADLAAAYLARGRALDRREDLQRALDTAAAAAALDPAAPEPAFNRGLALEWLGDVEGARGAWKQYLRLDRRSPWAAEARDHLARLESSKKG